MDAKILESLGIGLSRLLRYSYGGFLLIVFAGFMEPDKTKPAIEAMSWQLAAVAAIVVGSGIYAVHREIIVPIHHALLCLFWWGVDKGRGVAKERSANPTRWLGSIKVPLVWRIPAYTVLRRGDIFKEERTNWDLAHAESGLVLMTCEAFVLAAVYASREISPPVGSQPLAGVAIVLFVFSFGGFIQHAVESLRFKKKAEEVKSELREAGFITD
jgi:hypothetical protein